MVGEMLPIAREATLPVVGDRPAVSVGNAEGSPPDREEIELDEGWIWMADFGRARSRGPWNPKKLNV